jgi:predicted amidohydrolase
MAHLDNPPPTHLRLTHCFRPFTNAPVQKDGQVREEVLEARRCGVIFDIGHGSGSFGFRTARERSSRVRPWRPNCVGSLASAPPRGNGVSMTLR